MDQLISTVTPILAAVGVLAVLFVAYQQLQKNSSGAVEAAVKAALQPILFQAIMSAYRLSEQSVDQGFERLKGLDKKQIADSVYDNLPPKIGNYDTAVVKQFVSKEQFAQLTQGVFEQFNQYYLQNREHFEAEFQKWAQANKPGGA